MSGTDTLESDAAVTLRNRQQRARHVALILCRAQQRLESRMLVNTGIPGLTGSEASGSRNDRPQAPNAAWQTVDGSVERAVACEAEVFAVTEELKLQDAIPDVVATSLAGVVAKLEMIVGADREIDDPTDFPWPYRVRTAGPEGDRRRHADGSARTSSGPRRHREVLAGRDQAGGGLKGGRCG